VSAFVSVPSLGAPLLAAGALKMSLASWATHGPSGQYVCISVFSFGLLGWLDFPRCSCVLVTKACEVRSCTCPSSFRMKSRPDLMGTTYNHLKDGHFVCFSGQSRRDSPGSRPRMYAWWCETLSAALFFTRCCLLGLAWCT